jgi:hypothetical protein
VKRPFSTLSTYSPSLPSTPSSPSSSDDGRPHKKLALSLHRLSLSSTPIPEPAKDIDMRQRRSYEKDAFTTVIQSLSTTDDDDDDDDDDGKNNETEAQGVGEEAPFPRGENHVSIISEIEKRLTQFPTKLLIPATDKERVETNESALVLYRSPESMGLPRSERHHAEELKAALRKRIMEKRRKMRQEDGDGYEADAEDWEEVPCRKPHEYGANSAYRGNGNLKVNGFSHGMSMGGDDVVVSDASDDDEEDEGDMMDLD